MEELRYSTALFISPLDEENLSTSSHYCSNHGDRSPRTQWKSTVVYRNVKNTLQCLCKQLLHHNILNMFEGLWIKFVLFSPLFSYNSLGEINVCTAEYPLRIETIPLNAEPGQC
jgi:hypothetical protein